MATHLRPTAPIAADALLPGDPGRALGLAQALLDRPRMANHNRGLWGYTGRTEAGGELTIQATGIGGPSVAVVLAELAEHGVRRAIRLGTCSALDPDLPVGTVLCVDAAIAAEGASVALGAPATARPNADLQERLLALGATAATVASADLYYDPRATARHAAWVAAGARAVEMGSATLFSLAPMLGVDVASGLVVARSAAGGEPLDDEALERASIGLGELAASALSGAVAHSTPRLP